MIYIYIYIYIYIHTYLYVYIPPSSLESSRALPKIVSASSNSPASPVGVDVVAGVGVNVHERVCG